MMAKKPPPNDVPIGKFDFLAAYICAGAMLDGEARESGMVAAVIGAKPHRNHTHHDDRADKHANEKNEEMMTAESLGRPAEISCACSSTVGSSRRWNAPP